MGKDKFNWNDGDIEISEPTENYNPAQPRDSDGKFGHGTGSGHVSSAGNAPSSTTGSASGSSPVSASPNAVADKYGSLGRDGKRYRTVSKDTTHEGVGKAESKHLSPEDSRSVLSWHDGMTQVGVNGPNGKVPDASRPALNDLERGSLQKYTYKNDRVLNGVLRGDDKAVEGSPYNKAFYGEMHAGMQSAFSKAPVLPTPVKVVRGMFGEGHDPAALKGFLDHVNGAAAKGGVVSFPGYMSTAAPGGLSYRLGLDDGVPKAFKGKVTLSINAVHGLDMGPHSQLPGEKEFLLNHNSKFRVKKVTKKGDRWHVELDQLPPTSTSPTGNAEPIVNAAFREEELSEDDKALLAFLLSDEDAAAKWLDNADYFEDAE